MVRFRGSCVSVGFLNQKYLCKQFHILPVHLNRMENAAKSADFSNVQCHPLQWPQSMSVGGVFQLLASFPKPKTKTHVLSGLTTDFRLMFIVIFLLFISFYFASGM